MELTFHSMAELDEFAEVWTRGRIACAAALREGAPTGRLKDLADAVARDMRGQDDRPVTAEGAVIRGSGEQSPDYPNAGDGQTDGKDSQEPAGADAGESPSTDPAPVDTPKRKRRTKAQIAADEAAAQVPSAANPPVESPRVTPPGEHGPLMNETPAAETVTTELHPDVLALAATIDGSDSLAHMNEARAFIASQGFPTYSETFKLTGLPSAIAGYTPEQVALHRAVMQWLIAQGGAA